MSGVTSYKVFESAAFRGAGSEVEREQSTLLLAIKETLARLNPQTEASAPQRKVARPRKAKIRA